MYSYTWDKETGGLLLNTSPLQFSNEPRPVYYQELDYLGFDHYWDYAKDDSAPYMWAEGNKYYYFGELVAQTKGGSVYKAPEILLVTPPDKDHTPLRFVDINLMIDKNRKILEGLINITIKQVYDTYINNISKIDVFYVAFSGGKDSVVTLDIVQRALPHNMFKVIFGDTGMEFPDTYKTVNRIERHCQDSGIDFIRAHSALSPEETWKKFGPPATVNRWCCSVHKTAPQILKLRKLLSKSNFTGLAFIGIRASESLARSEYDYLSVGEKHKGQYSCNPIIEWNSAEVFLYIFQEHLILNDAYKKGNKRAGCLVCPRASERNEYMGRLCYTNEYDKYIQTIKDLYSESFPNSSKMDEFIMNGGWKARKNGRDLSIKIGYSESENNTNHIIKIRNPKTDWKEWIKTIGVLTTDNNSFSILFHGDFIPFSIIDKIDGYDVEYKNELVKENPLFVKLLKNVFRKAACCITCQECEADCHNGCISMSKGNIHISDKCTHCANCHKVEKGCLIYKSLEIPKNINKMTSNISLNCYSHHAPKKDWFNQYFNFRNNFDNNHSLGSQMYSFFKRFLRDADLLDSKGFSHFAETIAKIGLDDNIAWGLMLVNLSYTPQINWFVRKITFNEIFNKDYTLSLLINDGAKESWVSDIWSSFSRFLDLPFSQVGMGNSIRDKSKMISLQRAPWENPDSKTVLYSLYKYAEACGGYYQFSLSRLIDNSIDSDGVSPTQIFGINRDTLTSILKGLSINYPDYISVSFTHDLDNITLREDKNSQEVLNLF